MYLKRQDALLRAWANCELNKNLPIHHDITNSRPQKRLKSRKPAWRTVKHLHETNFHIIESWRTDWNNSSPDMHNIVTDPTSTLKGQDLSCKDWSTLNRLRTEYSRCDQMLHKRDLVESPSCDCKTNYQSMSHIISDCPIRAFQGTIRDLLLPSPEAIHWIKNLDVDL